MHRRGRNRRSRQMQRARCRRGKHVAETAAFVSCLVASAMAAAATTEDTAAAQALFEEGRRLVKAGSFNDACPKFAESQRLDPAIGTHFQLAECLERTGQIAAAWTHYVAVSDEASLSGPTEREKFVRARAEALRPRPPVFFAGVDTPGACRLCSRDNAAALPPAVARSRRGLGARGARDRFAGRT